MTEDGYEVYLEEIEVELLSVFVNREILRNEKIVPILLNLIKKLEATEID